MLLPGSGAEHPLEEVARGEEQQHDQHPGEFSGDDGDGGVKAAHVRAVAVLAADLAVRAHVLLALGAGMSQRGSEKENGQKCQVGGEPHRCLRPKTIRVEVAEKKYNHVGIKRKATIDSIWMSSTGE